LDESRIGSTVPDCEPEDESAPPEAAPPAPEDWQEATLRRLEAWVEERERLLAELERRIEAQAHTCARA
jgi:hypothetical protein